MNRILLSLIFSSLFLSAQSNPVGKWTIDIEWVDTIIESSIEGDPDSETNKMTAKMVRAQFADQSIVFKEDGTMVDPRGGDAQWKIKEDKILAKPEGSEEWIEAPFEIKDDILYVGSGPFKNRMPFKKIIPQEKKDIE
jgi:hypothetical protein